MNPFLREPTPAELHSITSKDVGAVSPPHAAVGEPVWFRRPDGVGWRLGRVARNAESSVFVVPVGQTFEVQVFRANVLAETPPERTWTAKTAQAVAAAGSIRKALEEPK